MTRWLELLLVLLTATNLLLLGSSRLTACIRFVSIQGVLLAFLPLLANADGLHARLVLLAVGSMGVKGVAFPWLLSRAVREAEVRREVEPYVGYTHSILLGIIALGASLWLGSRLEVPRPLVSPMVVPVALSMILIGLFLIVSRRKALSQVLGYLVMENGIYAFGVALAQEQPFLVEMGVLLDVFVGVFVMGITMFHINRTFDHIDTDRLSTLKD